MNVPEEFVEGQETSIQASIEPAGRCVLPDAMNPSALVRMESYGPIPPRPYRRSCSFNCYCDCHSQDQSSANMTINMNKVLRGTLSKSSRRCSVPGCYRTVNVSPKRLVYPRARIRSALTSLVIFRGFKVKHYLNTYRMIAETSDSMRYTKHGDLARLKACINSGIATPFDTGPDGWSLLHVSQPKTSFARRILKNELDCSLLRPFRNSALSSGDPSRY